jgi:D-beta-D-heptose 7-phosphate kinase/D-beta-D-heptose 1-phosphate adenosyltransferase
MLAALACVDHVLVFDEDTPREMLRRIRPDVLVKGGTYAVNEVVGHEIVTGYGGEVHVTSVIGGVSTTKILDSVTRRSEPTRRSA